MEAVVAALVVKEVEVAIVVRVTGVMLSEWMIFKVGGDSFALLFRTVWCVWC